DLLSSGGRSEAGSREPVNPACPPCCEEGAAPGIVRGATGRPCAPCNAAREERGLRDGRPHGDVGCSSLARCRLRPVGGGARTQRSTWPTRVNPRGGGDGTGTLLSLTRCAVGGEVASSRHPTPRYN